MRIFIFILVTLLALAVHAQHSKPDSLQQLPLPTVTVRSSQLDGTSKTFDPSVHHFENNIYSTTVVDALQKSGMLFVKSYGLGSLATASVRGGAAGQTVVSWDGIALQSPMLGLLDLSLLPSIHLDHVAVVGGGRSASLGSGAVAGLIALSSGGIDTAYRTAHHFAIGSFGQFHNAHRISGGSEKFRFKISSQIDKATNDFSYTVRADLPERQITHAEFQQQAWQQSFIYHPHPRHTLTVHAWQQSTRRNLPPTAVQNISLANQDDDFWRQQLIWQARGKKAIWTNQWAYNKEDIHYRNPLAGVDAPSTFGQFTFQSKRTQQIGKLYWKSGAQLISASAEANEYRQVRRQHQLGIYQDFEYLFNRAFKGDVQFRLHQVDQQTPLVALRAHLYRRFSEKWILSGSISRDFRVPTLNDLYWRPGGNPDLKTEVSWGQELTISNRSKNNAAHYFQLTAYNRKVDDWIQWSQQDGNVFWSAGNVTKVWSRGLEFYGALRFYTHRSEFDLNVRYHYTRSTYEEAVVNPAIEKGNQLWYTPIHQASMQFNWKHRSWLLRYTNQYISETEGINEDLTAYQLAAFRLVWRGQEQGTRYRIFGEINNLWNANYRVIERRPMPGRNLQIGVQINFSLLP